MATVMALPEFEPALRGPAADQFRGCLLGQSLGDALGFLVEERSPRDCRQYVNEVLRHRNLTSVTNMVRGGFAFGQYSDDSQLARELLQSYAALGRFDPADYAKRIARLFADGRAIGYGRSTEKAAQRLETGVPWYEAGTPAPEAGNGSAMRAAPIGLMCYDDPAALLKAAAEQSRITHQDARCAAGSIAVAGAVGLILQGWEPRGQYFVVQLSRWVRPYDADLSVALLQMPALALQPPDIACRFISRVGLPPTNNEGYEGISPFVTGSVLWSLYSFLRHPGNYWDSVCEAIAVGGDVDTTAAMAGAISGARLGMAALPAELTHYLNDQGTWGEDELISLADRCYRVKHGSPG
jgi:ADP-ribosylglycohydrolase